MSLEGKSRSAISPAGSDILAPPYRQHVYATIILASMTAPFLEGEGIAAPLRS